MIPPTFETQPSAKLKLVLLLALLIFFESYTHSQQTSLGLKIGLQMFGSFNASGGGPMVGGYWRRHAIGASMTWLEFTTIGIMPNYQFRIGNDGDRVCSFPLVSD
jgi:hypothetical protein